MTPHGAAVAVTRTFAEATAGHAAAVLLEALHDAPAIVPLTRSRTTDTSLVDVPGLGRVVRKRWRWPGLRERVRGVGRTTALARTPAEREFAALGRTYAHGAVLFHPRPLATRVERSGPFASRAMLLLEEVRACAPLAEFLRDEPDPCARHSVLQDLAARVRAMHADGVHDGDLHPRNVLVDPAARRAWKVDCGRQRAHRSPLAGRRADHDLACLDVGLARFATRTERLRALLAYLGPDGDRTSVRHRARAIDALRRRLEPTEARRLPGAGAE